MVRKILLRMVLVVMMMRVTEAAVRVGVAIWGV